MTPTLVWIVGGGLLMSAIALVGSITLFLSERTLKQHADIKANLVHFTALATGLGLLLALRIGRGG